MKKRPPVWGKQRRAATFLEVASTTENVNRNLTSILNCKIFNSFFVNVLLDTGSGVSLISQRTVWRAGASVEPLQTGDSRVLFAANGSTIDVLGAVHLPFQVQDQTYHHRFFVVKNLPNQVLFGLDLLKRFNVSFDFQLGKVTFSGKHTQFFVTRDKFLGVAKLIQTVKIPPGKTILAPLDTRNISRLKIEKRITLKPILAHKLGLRFRGLNLAKKGVYLRIVNRTKRPRTLYANIPLGLWQLRGTNKRNCNIEAERKQHLDFVHSYFTQMTTKTRQERQRGGRR